MEFKPEDEAGNTDVEIGEDQAATLLGRTHGAPKSSRQSVGKIAQKRIGTHLRAMYQDFLEQPVPSRFSELIGSLGDDKAKPAVPES